MADQQVANQICSLNGGVRVQPLPGYYYKGGKMSPTYNEVEWPQDLLIKAICNEYPGKFETTTEDNFTFLKQSMFPLEVLLRAKVEICKKSEARARPKKKARQIDLHHMLAG